MPEHIPEQIAAMSAHDIKPIIEEFTHKTTNEAIQKLRDGTIRFRGVLKNDLI